MTETTGKRAEQVTVPDSSRAAEEMARNLSDSVLRAELERRGFTVTRPGEVVWVNDPTDTPEGSLCCVGRTIIGDTVMYGDGTWGGSLGSVDVGESFQTEAEARAAVERAIKDQTND